MCKNLCTISVFQKLWPFVSVHVRAFPTFKPVAKSTCRSRFYHNYSLPASKLAFVSNFSHFPSLHARLHRVSWKRTKLDSMATFWARIPYRDIVSELDFFKNQITNYARVVSRRKSNFERLNFEEITPFRSLEDEYAAISGLYSFVQSSVETASHRYLSSSDLHEMIPLKFKPSKDDFLLDTRLG